VQLGSTQLAAIGGAAPGGHFRNIEIFDLRPSPTATVTSWTVPFPGDAKNRQAVFLHDNDLLVAGGNNSVEQHDFNPGNFLNQAYKIHLGSLAVTRLADLPVNRQSLEAALSSGKRDGVAYVVGGFGHDGEKARSFADVFRYDLEKDQWQKLASQLPRPRSQFGLVERDSQLWIFGGLDYDPKRGTQAFQHPLDILSWKMKDPQADFVVSSHRLPRPRRAFGGALFGDRYYLVGGMQDNFQLVEECDVFNFSSGQWEAIPAPKQPRISPRLVALKGKLYLTGGSSPNANGEFRPNPSIEVFDPETRSWSTIIEKLPVSPDHLQVLALRDRLLLYSANGKDSKSIQLLLIDPGTTQLTQSIHSVTSAAPHP